MEGKGVDEALLGGGAGAGGGGVQLGEAAHHADDVGAIRAAVTHVAGREEAAAQHLGHVAPLHRLDPFLALAPEHVEQLGDQLLRQLAALPAGVGGQQ